MARTREIGLRYFPMDTGIFSDRKIRRLLKTFGAKGYLIYNFVLCEIYRDKGYFVQCDEDFLFDIADNLAIDENLVKEVISFCVSNVLFNKRVFDVENILTSAGIQKRYLEVKSRSEAKILDSYKINVTEMAINVTKKPINATLIPQKKSKVKENKEKEIIPPLPPMGETGFDLSFIEIDCFRQLFMEWLSYKREIRDGYKSQKSVEIAYSNLLKKGNKDFEICKEIVYQSIGNN